MKTHNKIYKPDKSFNELISFLLPELEEKIKKL